MKRRWYHNGKTWRGPLVLAVLFLVLLAASVPRDVVYGSHMDWFSQHVALGESIREACIKQHTFFPSFLELGCGSSGYQCSYYGFGRPDIVLGCLFPRIPMEYLLSGYMLAGYFLAVQLGYQWLKGELGEEIPAFFGSVLFLTAACFFQTHRQVMFVNYMPVLLGALLLVQKKKRRFLPPVLALIYLHSFYFAPACFLALAWYWYQKEGRAFWKPFLGAAFLSTAMAMVLLLPTGLVLLEHKRGSSGGVWEAVMAFWPDFSSLVYSPYGIGLTAAALYLLLAGISFGRYRGRCLALLGLCFWGGAAWLLNGTLYVRAKSLMPFLPLAVLAAVQVLAWMWKEGRWKLWPLVPLGAVLALHGKEERFPLVLAEYIVLGLVCGAGALLGQRNRRLPVPLLLGLLVLPCLLYVQTAGKEQWVTKEEVRNLAAQEAVAEGVEEDSLYRFENLASPLEAGNRPAGGKRTALYTSVKNQDYIGFYYDTLLTPVQINNRLAVLPADNPFLLRFLGVRTVETGKGVIPAGYQETGKGEIPAGCRELAQAGDHVLAENASVMPLAYFSSSLLEESRFESLSDLEKAEALMQYTVVPETGEKRENLVSRWESLEVPWEGNRLPERIVFPEKLEGKLLVVEFDVESLNGGKVVIDIGGQRNKLSAETAPYPNGNRHFRYVFLTPPEGIQELPVSLVSGNAVISNARISALDAGVLENQFWTEVTPEKRGRDEILSCRVTAREEGYFVTSIPVQKGMEILVDGKPAPLEKVNTIFAGTRLSRGTHQVQIRFTPPGKGAGTWISLAALAVWAAGAVRRKRHGYH